MRILVAPDKFKGSLSASTAAAAIRRGVVAALPSAAVDSMPIADGGEGTLEVLIEAVGGTIEMLQVPGPCGLEVEARLGWLDARTADIESSDLIGAAATGVDSHPLQVGSVGVGAVLLHARERGADCVLIGLGGSRTIDGGLGMLQALGAVATGAHGPVSPNGGGLLSLQSLDVAAARSALQGVRLIGLCDVSSPVGGDRGARLYMAQKGADDALAARLESALTTMSRSVAPALTHAPGTGAAGGLGLGLGILGATLVSGAEYVLDHLDARRRVTLADIVLGGEGRVDAQTSEGKAMAALAELARNAQTPLVLLTGAREDAAQDLHARGVSAIFVASNGPSSLSDALCNAEAALEQLSYEVACLIATLSK